MSLDIYLKKDNEYLWSANITHNMNEAAMAAGAYHCLWRPEEIGVAIAKDNIDNLRRSLAYFYLSYKELEKLNPSNGWGDLDGLIKVTRHYLEACIAFPDAEIEVCR